MPLRDTITSAILFSSLATGCAYQDGPEQTVDNRNGTMGNVTQTQGNTTQSTTQSPAVTLNLALDPSAISTLFGNVVTPFNPTKEQISDAVANVANLPQKEDRDQALDQLQNCSREIPKCQITTE